MSESSQPEVNPEKTVTADKQSGTADKQSGTADKQSGSKTDSPAGTQDAGSAVAHPTSTHSEGAEVRLPRSLSVLLVLGSLVILVAGLQAFGSSLAPFALALVIIVLVRPVQTGILKRGGPKWLAGIAMLLAAFGTVALIVLILVWSVAQLVSYLSGGDYSGQLEELQADLLDVLAEVGVTGADLDSWVDSINVASFAGSLLATLSGIAGLVSLLTVALLTMIFLAGDSLKFVDTISTSVRRYRPDVPLALNNFASQTRTYFFVNTIFGFIVAAADVVMLQILGVPLALVWGVLALITSYIPNIGFIIGLVPAALVATLAGGPRTGVIVVIGYFIINTVIDSILKPRFVGDALGLSGTLTFVSLIFWSWVLGPIGALLAVPLTLLAKALLVDIDPDARWLDPLISLNSDDPYPSEDEQ